MSLKPHPEDRDDTLAHSNCDDEEHRHEQVQAASGVVKASMWFFWLFFAAVIGAIALMIWR